jgi:transposase-like protein
MERFTFKDFEQMFPDDAACLEWLRQYLYPDGIFCKLCGKVRTHHRVQSRPSYSCDVCGHHVHPTADTIFHKSSTSLKTWFHAIYLMASTRCGISAKQIERETGVTYKTAWRMFNKIRSLLSEDIRLEGSTVEMDETYVGGAEKNKHFSKRGGISGRPSNLEKQTVFGMVERGGRVVAHLTPDAKAKSLLPVVHEYVMPSSTIYTDEWVSYDKLANATNGYVHKRISHSQKVYVMGDVHTNTIEGFWSLIKRGIGGVYHTVSRKHLQSYLDEYAFRYNRRNDTQPMFTSMLERVEKSYEQPSLVQPQSQPE